MIDILLDNVVLILLVARLLCIALNYVPRRRRVSTDKKAHIWKRSHNSSIRHTVLGNITSTVNRCRFRLAFALLGSGGMERAKITKVRKRPAIVNKKSTVVRTRTCGQSDMPKQQFSLESGKTVKNLARYATRKIYVLDFNGNEFETQMDTAVILILEDRIPNQPLQISRSISGLIREQECKRCHQHFFYVRVSRPHTVCGSCLRRRKHQLKKS